MTSPDPDTSPDPETRRGYDRVSHGFAPEGSPESTPPVPLEDIVRDVVDNLSETAKAEMTLLEARAALAGHGAKWASAWGFVAACALLVAMLAIAFGAILVLATHIGPLLATLVVVAALVALAAFAGWRARLSVADVRTALRRDLMHEAGED